MQVSCSGFRCLQMKGTGERGGGRESGFWGKGKGEWNFSRVWFCALLLFSRKVGLASTGGVKAKSPCSLVKAKKNKEMGTERSIKGRSSYIGEVHYKTASSIIRAP